MTNLREQLELIEVQYKDEKAILTFLDEENGEVLEVNFNKQSYDEDANGFVDDPEKAEKVEEWCQEYFNCSFDELSSQTGVKKNVYKYDRFNSLWETQEFSRPEKFDIKDKGKMFSTEIEEVIVDNIGIHIRYKIEGKLYQTNMNFSKWVESLRKWFENPIDKTKQLERFKDKFGFDAQKETDLEEMKGKPIMVEVRQVGKDKAWGDIKRPTQWN